MPLSWQRPSANWFIFPVTVMSYICLFGCHCMFLPQNGVWVGIQFCCFLNTGGPFLVWGLCGAGNADGLSKRKWLDRKAQNWNAEVDVHFSTWGIRGQLRLDFADHCASQRCRSMIRRMARMAAQTCMFCEEDRPIFGCSCRLKATTVSFC